MLSLILKLLTAKDLIKTLGDAARIAKSARDIVVETRQGNRGVAARVPDHEARERLVANQARMETLVGQQARLLEQTADQIERLTVQVRRASLQATLGLAAAIVALLLAIAALIRG